MRHVHRADQVHSQHALPVGRLQVPEREAELARADAHGEDDVVQAAEFRQPCGGGLLHLGVSADVRDEAQGRPAELRFGFAGEFLDGAVPIDEDQPGAFAAERQRDRPADAVGGADHHRHVVFNCKSTGPTPHLAAIENVVGTLRVPQL